MKKFHFALLICITLLGTSLTSQGIPDFPCLFGEIEGDGSGVDFVIYDSDNVINGGIYMLPLEDNIRPTCYSEDDPSFQMSFHLYYPTLTSDLNIQICFEDNGVYGLVDDNFTNTFYDEADSQFPSLNWKCVDVLLTQNDNSLCQSAFFDMLPNPPSVHVSDWQSLDFRIRHSETQEELLTSVPLHPYHHPDINPQNGLDGFQHVTGGVTVLYSDLISMYGSGHPELIEPNMYIDENTTLVLDINDAQNSTTFGFLDFDFYLGKDAKIEVPDGIDFLGLDCQFYDCGEPWIGVEVQENGFMSLTDNNGTRSTVNNADQGIVALSGSSIVVSGTDFYNCVHGVQSESGVSSIIVDNIFDNCDIGIKTLETSSIFPTLFSVRDNTFQNSNQGTGIHFSGDYEVGTLFGNLFDQLEEGIRITNTDGAINLVNSNPVNTFDRCDIGISINRGAANIRNQQFLFNDRGIAMLNGSSPSLIQYNDIGYVTTGIAGYNSDFTADHNHIGLNNGTGEKGIQIFNDNMMSEIDQNNIDATQVGIEVISSTQFEISTNILNLPAGATSGISLSNYTGETHDNDVFVSNAKAGIWLSGIVSEEAVLQHNEIDVSVDNNTRGLLVTGSTNAQILENEVLGTPSFGLQAVNSADLFLECNDLTGQNRALEVNVNSNDQTILTNYLRGGNHDFMTRSLIGLQTNHGNLFYGLDENDFTDSRAAAFDIPTVMEQFVRFLYNDVLYDQVQFPNRPDLGEWNPTGLFQDNQIVDEICTGNPGGSNGGVQSGLEVCNYLSYLDSIQLIRPNQYAINLYHLYLKYLDSLDPSVWPHCLKQVWLADQSCLKSIAQMQHDLLVTKSQFSNTYAADRQQYINDLEQGNPVNQTLLNSLVAEKQSKDQAVDTELNQQLSTVNQLPCTGVLEGMYKDVYLITLKVDLDIALTSSDISRLEFIADECPYDYGDPVHWARAILTSRGDTSRYDQDDENCIPTNNRSSDKQSSYEELNLELSPNPTFDRLNLSFKEAFTGQLVIVNAQGLSLQQFDLVERVNMSLDVSEFYAGIYYLQLITEEDKVMSKKFIIQK